MNLVEIYQRPPRVVVAEDDTVNRELLDELLTISGCLVVATPDGQSALEKMIEDPPDLLLADVDMPRMDGLDLCQRVKTMPSTHLVPVIIITAHNSEAIKRRARIAGADAFIEKPYDSQFLLEQVGGLMRATKPPQS